MNIGLSFQSKLISHSHPKTLLLLRSLARRYDVFFSQLHSDPSLYDLSTRISLFKSTKSKTIVTIDVPSLLNDDSNNVKYVNVVKASSCSVVDLFDSDIVLIDSSGLEVISSRFGGVK